MTRLVNTLVLLLKSPRVRRFGRWTQQHSIRLATMGVVASLAVLLLVVFVAVNWYHIADADFSRTGLQIMLGLNNEDFQGEDGFGRSIDWLLLLIPLGSMTLLVVAAMVFTKRLPYAFGTSSAVGIGLMLFVTPWVWQDLSSNTWRADYDDTVVELLTDGYRTALPMILGFLIFLFSSAAWLAFYAHQIGLFAEEALPVSEPKPAIPESAPEEEVSEP